MTSDILRHRRSDELQQPTNSNKLDSLELEDSETWPNPLILYSSTTLSCIHTPRSVLKMRCDVVGCGHELGQRPHGEKGLRQQVL